MRSFLGAATGGTAVGGEALAIEVSSSRAGGIATAWRLAYAWCLHLFVEFTRRWTRRPPQQAGPSSRCGPDAWNIPKSPRRGAR